MNNLNLILDKIYDEAALRIGEINAARDGKIAEINDETEVCLKDIFARTENEAIKTYENIISKADSSGKLLEKKIILRAKTILIDQVYAGAEEYIRSLPEDEYVMVLSRLLGDAVIERMETLDALVEKYGEEEYSAELKVPYEAALSPEDAEKYGSTVISKADQYIANKNITVPKIKLAKEPAQIDCGVIVKYGDTETNCSVASMIASVKEKTDSKVAEILFSSKDNGENKE